MKHFAIALICCLATTTLFAQVYCSRPQQPSTSYCGNGDMQDMQDCQNRNIEAINEYNRDAQDYNECIQQEQENRQQQQQKQEQYERSQERAQYCATHSDLYNCQ